MRTITCSLPDSLYAALQKRMDAEGETSDHIVTMALSTCLEMPLHTLFQVSTSAALVEGIHQGAVRVSRLLRYGDFGLGTFVRIQCCLPLDLETLVQREWSSSITEGHRQLSRNPTDRT
jgi:hypothetical protein